MFLYRFFTLLPLIFALQACKDEGAPSKVSSEQPQKEIAIENKLKPANTAFDLTPPEPNLFSPDNAVKSWWELNDAIDKAENEECKNGDPRLATIQAARRNLATGNTKEFFQKRPNCLLENFDRTIERASVETETRAVVIANIKNTTKIPEDSVLSKYSKDYVENGINYKYILTRESDKWYVDEVYEYSTTNVLLKKDPWNRRYKYEKNQPVFLDVRNQ